MAAPPPLDDAVRRASDRGGGPRGRRSLRTSCDRNRRLVGHQDRDRARAGPARRRGHPHRARRGRGEAAAAQIRHSTGNAAVDVQALELADLASVGAFLHRWEGPLDILFNSAGVMAIPERTLTPGGDELHFATNHLGRFRAFNVTFPSVFGGKVTCNGRLGGKRDVCVTFVTRVRNR